MPELRLRFEPGLVEDPVQPPVPVADPDHQVQDEADDGQDGDDEQPGGLASRIPLFEQDDQHYTDEEQYEQGGEQDIQEHGVDGPVRRSPRSASRWCRK